MESLCKASTYRPIGFVRDSFPGPGSVPLWGGSAHPGMGWGSCEPSAQRHPGQRHTNYEGRFSLGGTIEGAGTRNAQRLTKKGSYGHDPHCNTHSGDSYTPGPPSILWAVPETDCPLRNQSTLNPKPPRRKRPLTCPDGGGGGSEIIHDIYIYISYKLYDIFSVGAPINLPRPLFKAKRSSAVPRQPDRSLLE